MRRKPGDNGDDRRRHERLGPRLSQRRPHTIQKARSALAEARSAGGVFVPLLVLAELSWVLRGRWERQRVLDTIEALLQTRGVTVESPALALRALQACRKGAAGFADHLIAVLSVEFGAEEVLTFDKAFARVPGVRRLK